MAASSVIPSLLLFLFVAAVAAASSNPNGYMHLRFYNHERILGSGPSATVVYAVQRRDSNSGAGFGNVIVYDNLLRSGVETDSPIVGRNQGMGVGSSLAENSGLTNFQLVFTAGKYSGSSLALQGLFPVAPLGTVFERAITGGTGKFRLARGYLLTTEIWPEESPEQELGTEGLERRSEESVSKEQEQMTASDYNSVDEASERRGLGKLRFGRTDRNSSSKPPTATNNTICSPSSSSAVAATAAASIGLRFSSLLRDEMSRSLKKIRSKTWNLMDRERGKRAVVRFLQT
ncbi:hypothetical protein ZIOFF_004148 [Zingiber officinale]|uniref:Dirigent protein n=1 Tax=Zingiber officinale TaxID=94328 RepID=A0A8J5M089_ZINOF|nr:hypothetical protein ZIOFF_004148 [Zingiber officinale]